MAIQGSKPFHVAVTPPPRTLNVNKFVESRGPEIESLHSIIANRLNNDFRSQRNKRRRTTSYDNRLTRNKRRKRQNLGQTDESATFNSDKDQKKLSRRVLRRIELRKNPKTGFCTSGDGTKRLRTHLWHAKRFAMTKLWGFHLPLGLQGRGRGSRALLKWFKHGATVHDASYYCAVQLEGPEDSLLSILRMVLVPTPSVHLEELSTSVLSGVSYGSAMLHHVGAPSSQLIAPVTYMWRPFIRHNIDIDAEKGLPSAGLSGPQSSMRCSSFRQVWIWIHAATIHEGYDALQFACQEQTDETGISINCFSLEGQLAKLEVLGSKAIQILQKILHPVSVTSASSFQLRKCSAVEADSDTQLQKSFIFEHATHLPSHAILSLTVEDPRDFPKKGIESVAEPPSTGLEVDALEDMSNEHVPLSTCSNKNKEVISSLWFKSEVNGAPFSDNKNLWDWNEVNPPMEENLLCMEKHQRHMAFFNLHNKNSGMSSEAKRQSSRSYPILLLKNNNQRGSCIGWSIILPLSWVKAFWVPLVSCGAHAIGLRERHWIACDVGLPCFPFDFPDSKAYTCFMATEAATSDQRAELRPPAMRPLRVPIPPPWDSVRLAFEEGTTSLEDTQALNENISSRKMDPVESLGEVSIERCSLALLQDDSPFQGYIARTSNILSNYLDEIHGGHLLLFPCALMGKKANIFKYEGKCSLGPRGGNQIPFDRRLCFVRVLLRTYKEGVFEEGSVVCAPCQTDISLWTSKSEEREGGLQIPQSSIGSYYVQQPSGKWELQKPEGPVARESHRWPIGFVTTGFVRGSTKPQAEAFCEATLLARLRGEQWDGMQEKRRKREIFVLVRNLRSAAYRLALATIVLEQQEEDVEVI